MRASIPASSTYQRTIASQLLCCPHNALSAQRSSLYAQALHSSGCSIQQPHSLQIPWCKIHQQTRSVQCEAGFGFGAGSKAAAKSKDCPCGSGKQYADCCQRFIKPNNKNIMPDTPEQLIAARYSAFCEKDVKFLKRTNHRNNPALQGSKTADDAGVQKKCTYEEDLAMTLVAVDFVNFKILDSSSSSSSSGSSSRDGSSSDSNTAIVDYAVTFKRKFDSQGQKVTDQQEETLCERTTVVRDDDGRWLVLGVEQIQPTAAGAS